MVHGESGERLAMNARANGTWEAAGGGSTASTKCGP